MRFGEQVLLRRRGKSWTQAQLAERSGVNKINISRIEKHRDENAVYLGTARRLAEALGCSLDELIGKRIHKE